MRVEASVVGDVRPDKRGARPVVLCVDDDRSSREMLRCFLRPVECDFRTAADGSEALDVLRECGEIALVITDFLMPVMDGAELCAAIERRRPDLKVLVISGSSAHELGALKENPVILDVLTKPLKRPEFLSAVYAALEAG